MAAECTSHERAGWPVQSPSNTIEKTPTETAVTKPSIVLALLALVLGLQHAEAAKLVAISGAGHESCGAWTKAQAHRPQVGADGVTQVSFDDMDSLYQSNVAGAQARDWPLASSLIAAWNLLNGPWWGKASHGR